MHQDKKKDLVISVNSGQLCKLIFWYRPAYRDMQSLTFSVPGVELGRNGTPWFKLIDFTRCLWSVGEANKILEVRLWNGTEVEEAASLESGGQFRCTGQLREITGGKSMQGMIRLPWMEDQSKSDQIGKKKISVGGELQIYAGLAHSKEIYRATLYKVSQLKSSDSTIIWFSADPSADKRKLRDEFLKTTWPLGSTRNLTQKTGNNNASRD